MAEQTVFIQGAGGAVIEMSLPLHETIAEQIEKGYARIVQPTGEQYDEAERPVDVPTLVTERPALNSSQAAWASWAVFNGADPEDANAATRSDLIERYGQIEPGNGQHVAEETPEPGDTTPPAGPVLEDEPGIPADPTPAA